MLIRKIQYQLKKVYKVIEMRTASIEINWVNVIFTFVSSIGIVLLGVNVFRIIKKGYERYEIITEEKKRLENLLALNASLKEDLKYYSSKEYIDLKAREELNLTYPNQRLVYIEKDNKNDLDITEKKEEVSVVKPSWKNWYNLIFK